MSINLNIVNKMGSKSGSFNKTSSSKSQRNIKNTQKSNLKTFSTIVEGGVNAVDTSLSLMSGQTTGVGLTKVAGATSAIIGIGLATTSKTHDVYQGIQQSKTGGSVYYSNMATRKKTLLMLGMNYLSGSIKNHLTTRHEIVRQNLELDYNREIYNLNNFGEKNKIR